MKREQITTEPEVSDASIEALIDLLLAVVDQDPDEDPRNTTSRPSY